MTSSDQKARGAFFTPPPVARFVADWALRTPDDQVLEPSCGEAEFLLAAVRRLKQLANARGERNLSPRVEGIEIHEPSSRKAAALVRAAGGDPLIATSDFFVIPSSSRFDAVIGNPPFIRFQDFYGGARKNSLDAASESGLDLSGLASSWAAFVVHSISFLKLGGRLGLVLPGELLSVNYAAPVREYLLQSFARVDVVPFSEPVFSGVQTDVVLLLADGLGGQTSSITIHAETTVANLGRDQSMRTWTPSPPSAKWTPARLSNGNFDVYDAAIASSEIVTAADWGSTSLGVVTGNNKFFTMGSEMVESLDLRPDEVLKLAPPVRPAKRGLAFTAKDWGASDASGAASWLFAPGDELSPGAKKYIETGVRSGSDLGYKCQNRTPWWRVPVGEPGDVIVTYMSSGIPRLVSNPLRLLHLNSLHKMTLKAAWRPLGRSLLSLAALNSLTIIGAETLGRSYGGGVLKLELGEVAAMPLPAFSLVKSAEESLRKVQGEVDKLLRSGHELDASQKIDDILLRGEMGRSRSDIEDLQAIHAQLRHARLNRAVRTSGPIEGTTSE